MENTPESPSSSAVEPQVLFSNYYYSRKKGIFSSETGTNLSEHIP